MIVMICIVGVSVLFYLTLLYLSIPEGFVMSKEIITSLSAFQIIQLLDEQNIGSSNESNMFSQEYNGLKYTFSIESDQGMNTVRIESRYNVESKIDFIIKDIQNQIESRMLRIIDQLK